MSPFKYDIVNESIEFNVTGVSVVVVGVVEVLGNVEDKDSGIRIGYYNGGDDDGDGIHIHY